MDCSSFDDSLKNSEGVEIDFVEELEDMDVESKKALLRAISEQTFVFEIIDIWSIHEEFELRFWQVETRQGARHFQTA